MKKILILILATLALSQTLYAYVLNKGALNGSRWRSYPIAMNINTADSGLSVENIDAIFSKEMNKWNGAIGFNALELDSNNVVSSGDTMKVDGSNQIGFSLNFQSDSGGFDPQSTVAVAGQYGDGYAMTDAFMVFNSQYVEWYADDVTSLQQRAYKDHLPTIVLHELGHVLGLGHSLNLSAIMAAVRETKIEMTLTDDDITGVKYLTSTDGSTSGGSSDGKGLNSTFGGCATITGTNGTGGSGNISGNAALMLLPMISLLLMRRKIAVQA